jgi:hypothetical protein
VISSEKIFTTDNTDFLFEIPVFVRAVCAVRGYIKNLFLRIDSHFIWRIALSSWFEAKLTLLRKLFLTAYKEAPIIITWCYVTPEIYHQGLSSPNIRGGFYAEVAGRRGFL